MKPIIRHMKRIRIIQLSTIALGLLFPATIVAQTQPQDSTMNRTVVVEQEYAPIIPDAAKINAVPKVEPPTVHPQDVAYDQRLQPLQDIPAGTMQAYGSKQTTPKATPRYLRLGYGNYGNLDIRANYLLLLGDKDRLNLTFRMDGMDVTLDLPEDGGNWSSYFYRTHAAVGYTHVFSKLDMDVAGHFDLSNFNLLPGSADGNQKFTAGDLHLGLASTADELPLHFQAETNLMLYERQHEAGLDNVQEVMARTKAHLTGDINPEQLIGLTLDMDNVFYRNNAFRNYTSIGINPYYHIHHNGWQLRLGVHADVAFGFGQALRVSPDVKAAYTFARNCQVYLQAQGGKLQNDFRRLERLTPYGQALTQPEATYEQLNAAVGFKAGTSGGFHIHLYGGYQDLKDDLYASLTRIGPSALYLQLDTWNTSNIYAGAEMSYDYKGLLTLSAQGVYRNWKVTDDAPAVLAFKPVFEGNVQVDIRPLSTLRLQAGYQGISRDNSSATNVDPVCNLYVGGAYEFVKQISVYARINNLLNKDYQLYWGYPTEGFNLVAGVSLRF